MDETVIKAYVLCDEVADSASGSGQKDLRGAGLVTIRSAGPFPIKRTLWVYIEMTDRKSTGNIQLAIMRADSGRRFFFREITVNFADPAQTTIIAIRILD
ncbi:MAG TPA: hypothetical protein VGZ47_09535, partial [Gemmataceae bacterium]|nr:hypothetical protein [Gemmataceae bacterium]